MKADGTVVAVGDNDNSKCEVSHFSEIVEISAGGSHTVGLKKDGTVVATKWSSRNFKDNGQSNVYEWMNIKPPNNN